MDYNADYAAGAAASKQKMCSRLTEIDPMFERHPGESLSQWEDGFIRTVQALIEILSRRD